MDHRSSSEHDRGRTPLAAAFAGLTVLAFYLAVMADYLPAFHPFSDDAGVIVNSCTPWFQASRWTEWFTRGWASYAVNYPDWGPFGNNTMKPVVNLVFLLEGKLTPLLGQGAFLILSYLAPAVTAFALVLMFRRLASATIPMATLFSVVIATSALWIGSLVNAVDMTNTLALMFSAIALAMLPLRDESPSLARGCSLVGVQLLAIFSHETALVLPLVCLALFMALSEAKPTVRMVWPFALPPLIWAGVRVLILQARSGVYALTAGGVWQPKVWGYWLINAVVPIDVRGLWMGRGLLPMHAAWERPLVLVAVCSVILVNLGILGALGWRLATKRTLPTLLLAIAFVLSTVPHLTTAFDPLGARFAGLSMIIGLLALVILYREHPQILLACALVLLAAQVTYCLTGLIQHKTDAKADAAEAGRYAAYVHDAAARYHPNRFVVVNDRFGQFDVDATVRFAAWPHSAFDVVTLDNLAVGPHPEGALSVTQREGAIVVDCAAHGDSVISFRGADRVDFSVANRGFIYTVTGPADSPTSFLARGPLGQGGTLVIGYEPDGSLLQPKYYR